MLAFQSRPAPSLTLLFLNGFVGFWEDMRAGDAVAALKASLKPEAHVKRQGSWRKMDATLLVPGDRVALNAGANVPADCRVCKGMVIQVDQAALTGESLPVSMGEGDVVKMGSTVVTGEVDGLVASTGIHTFFGKTAALIGSTHDVGNFQKVIISITRMLLVLSALLVVIAVTYLCVRMPGQVWPAISFGVVLLVASIPIAMQVVCTATMALGSRLPTLPHLTLPYLTVPHLTLCRWCARRRWRWARGCSRRSVRSSPGSRQSSSWPA